MRIAVAAALLLLVAVPAARADGDPASDYLYQGRLFMPFDLKVPAAKQHDLETTIAGVTQSGYPIRVAIISSAYDLGAVPSLWLKPRTYARFLGQELSFVYKRPLLIVMPNGFGFYRHGLPTNSEDALLAKVPVTGGVGLVDAAQEAVVKLAAAHGVRATPVEAPKSTVGRDRLIIVFGVCGLIALALLVRALLARRRP
jgi:hypothetical protein